MSKMPMTLSQLSLYWNYSGQKDNVYLIASDDNEIQSQQPTAGQKRPN